ncbi:unnamed protein product [Thelazia callipaeda]|uniref:Glycosyltransferase-like protein LARGE1 n=1 Tax=Thelazia callipaeda TaxID=103827 RepID=A0A0N5CMH1_THECL|nr:unnamed protein product [Thelazia callipaeda]
MKKRRKRISARCLWTSLLALCMIIYFSILIADTRSYNIFDEFMTPASGENSEKINQSRHDHCQVLHLALIVCGDAQWAYSLSTLAKSILRYRQQKVVFHLIADDIARRIISMLFVTWRLPEVKVIFYNTSQFMSRISWIPNRHYSGKYSFLKLILHEILPADVNKVITLDMDTLVMDDIGQLWSFFSKMSTLQAIGLIENLSDWYLTNTSLSQRKVWPAWDRGFNTGVMLLDLTKLRNMNWTFLWNETASQNIYNYGLAELADQESLINDIINAFINSHRWIVQRISCEWNFQLGFQSQQSLCPVKFFNLKLVHWNSPLKMRTVNRYAVFFRRYYNEMKDMEGNMFRSNRLRCQDHSKYSSISNVYEYDDNDDGCAKIRHMRWITYRTLLYIIPCNLTVITRNIVLITQFSMDRLMHFDMLLKHWDGPVSAAVYVSDFELSQLLQYFEDTNTFSNRTNVALHAVYKEGIYYPINYLRNVALNSSSDASFVFLIDVDFIPKPGLYSMLCQKLLTSNIVTKKAYVVPAFEYIGSGIPIVPETKNDLLLEIDKRRMQIFRQEIWIQGHAATNYSHWRYAEQEYSIPWRNDYEPYIVVRRSRLPLYDQRFAGFGWNKVSHIMSLNAAKYEFVVLPNAYIIHQPHLPSIEVAHYRLSATYRKCLKALKGEFVRDLIREQKKRQMLNHSTSLHNY